MKRACDEVREETLQLVKDPKRRKAVQRSFDYPSVYVVNEETRLERYVRVHVWALFEKGRPVRYNHEAVNAVQLVLYGEDWRNYSQWNSLTSWGSFEHYTCKKCSKRITNVYLEKLHVLNECEG